jgi:hypothetical protein
MVWIVLSVWLRKWTSKRKENNRDTSKWAKKNKIAEVMHRYLSNRSLPFCGKKKKKKKEEEEEERSGVFNLLFRDNCTVGPSGMQ